MKIAIPWILVVALLAGVGYLYSDGKKKDAALVRVTQSIAETEAQLQAANRDLKQLPGLNAELEQLKKDNEDLLRLRGEVSQLQAEKKTLTTQLQRAQSQVGQTAQQQQTQLAQLADENRALKAEQAAAAVAQSPQAQNQAKQLANACIANLRMIEAAKQAWGLENRRLGGAMPAPADLAPYLPNRVFPACPAGGVYSINALNVLATCSVPGHAITQ